LTPSPTAPRSRRLAIILALDAAGYSRQAERDEEIAVREIMALSERVAASAAAHGGRVFNTAGDGFMLEFPSADGAIAATEELLANSRVPLRAGAHLGEVVETETGDLLGHGVNVAARLRELAAPGELMLSDDVKRVVSASVARRMQKRGTVKLDKMNAPIDAFALTSGWAPPSGLRAMQTWLARRWRVVGAGAAAAILVIVAATWLLRPPPPSLLVAVLPFEASSAGSDAQALAGGISSSIAEVLSSVGVPVMSSAHAERVADDPSRARALGALYVVHGEVLSESGRMRLSVRIEDSVRGVTVLAKSFEGPIEDAANLREAAAADIANALTWGGTETSIAIRGAPDPEITAALLRIRDHSHAGEGMAAYEASRALVARAPDNATALAALAMQTGSALSSMPPDERAAAVARARDAAQRARRLDPQLGEAHVALTVATPPVMWSEREAILREAADAAPDSSVTSAALAMLWRRAGRLRDALPAIERATVRDPLSPWKASEHNHILLELGRFADAAPQIERSERLWPDLSSLQLEAAMYSGNHAAAETLLRGAVIPDRTDLPLMVRALRSRSADDRRALARFCADANAIRRFFALYCLGALAHLGEVDAAFRLADQIFPDQRAPTPDAVEARWLEGDARIHQTTYVLFWPWTAPMRADPRFAGVVERVGLLDYWRTSGEAPDFCAAERAPVCAGLSSGRRT
jgi:adenylate cyclase